MPQGITRIMHIDDTAITASTRTTEAGAVTSFVGWAAQVNWIGWTGILIALAGLLANLYFQRRRDKRERAEHVARMKAIREGCER